MEQDNSRRGTIDNLRFGRSYRASLITTPATIAAAISEVPGSISLPCGGDYGNGCRAVNHTNSEINALSLILSGRDKSVPGALIPTEETRARAPLSVSDFLSVVDALEANELGLRLAKQEWNALLDLVGRKRNALTWNVVYMSGGALFEQTTSPRSRTRKIPTRSPITSAR